MNELYKIGYMDGLTGVIDSEKEYMVGFLSSDYALGVRDGFDIRNQFYKPDIHH